MLRPFFIGEMPPPKFRCKQDHRLKSIVQILFTHKCEEEREAERNRKDGGGEMRGKRETD